jgi:hypothetical protein
LQSSQASKFAVQAHQMAPMNTPMVMRISVMLAPLLGWFWRRFQE